MPAPAPLHQPHQPHQPHERRALLPLWLGFGPLLALVGLRWVLQWLQERSHAAPAWRLEPFIGTQDPFTAFYGAGAALLALLLLAWLGRWLRRRWGARLFWRCLAGLWLALALIGGLVQWLQFANQRDLRPQAEPLAAQLLGRRAIAPTQRGPGGTLLVLHIPPPPSSALPLQALLTDPAAAALQPGQRLTLHWASGRWWGRYLTGWQAVLATGPATGPAAKPAAGSAAGSAQQ